jgi:predicted  nucleic acid-binding Zn-ribbon protein
MNSKDMADVDVHIKRIQEKLQQLIKQHHELQKENIRLKEELEQYDKQSSQNRQTIEILKQQVEVLKISSGTWDERDKKEFEKRINHYLKEIDKCITLLSE